MRSFDKRCLSASVILFALLSLAAPRVFAAETYTLDLSHSDVSFQIRHLVTKVRGKFDRFEGTIVMDRADLGASSVTFTIAAASINTANEQRDGHLRSEDFFDAEKFPEIVFVSSTIKQTGEDQFDVMGTLTMHGVARKITLPVSFLGEMPFRDSVRAGFETSITIDRKDWGISWNRALNLGGAILGDKVAIEVNLETIKQQASE